MINQRAKGSLGFMSALTVCGLLAVGAPMAHAVPALQLDIAGGFYNTATESILTNSDNFTLYALLDPTQVNASRGYFLSIAVEPLLPSAGQDLGSFSVNSNPINVTSGMAYGTPPLEGLVATFDGGDLAPHGVYPTYFREINFMFNPANTSGIYNTAVTPGGIQAGSGLLYAAFQVDMRLLNSPYQLHFDLYSERMLEGDIDVKNFAPFSHDAGTRRGVPEPSSALLMGVGLLGFGLWQRSRASQSV